MALDLGGRVEEARAGYEWLRGKQRADGSWHTYYLGDEVEDPTLDTNVTCYVATGAWHHYLTTGDTRVPPRAVAHGGGGDRLRARLPARDGRDRVARRRSRRRRAAHRVVEHPPQPALRDRDRGAARSRAPRLGAVARRARDRDRAPSRRVPRQGALGDGLVLPDPRRRAARLPGQRARRDRMVDVRGRKPRAALCVGPPVDHRGRDVRDGDGARRDRRARAGARVVRGRCSSCAPRTAATGPASHFEGEEFEAAGELYPEEQPTWNSAAVVLAANALVGTGPTAGLFRGERLPKGLTADELLAAGVEIERERAAVPPADRSALDVRDAALRAPGGCRWWSAGSKSPDATARVHTSNGA